MTAQPGSDEEFTDRLRKVTCAAFDVKPWEVGLGPVPWYARPVTAYRRWRFKRKHWD